MRVVYSTLIAVAVAVLLFHEFTTAFAGLDAAPTTAGAARGGGGLGPGHVVWALPAIALAAVVGAGLVVASGTQSGHWVLERLGVPWPVRDARPQANGLAWAAIGVLGVYFTDEAFAAFPGGSQVAALTLGGVLGYGTMRLHRHAIEHEAYRTFNLVAMLLAAGSLASMGTTSTGAWWTENFSTLGTSDDLAAACFNVGIVVSGAGMAVMSGSLTRAIPEARFGARRGGVLAMRVLIIAIGVSLVGVGLVPIDGATDLHNLAACGAAGSFAVLCLGIRLWARRLPRPLLIASYASIAIEVVAMIAYDGIGLFNLTVFEIVAFTLVFAWLIALVAITHSSSSGEATDAAGEAKRRRRPPRCERRLVCVEHEAPVRRFRGPPPARAHPPRRGDPRPRRNPGCRPCSAGYGRGTSRSSQEEHEHRSAARRDHDRTQ
ncbi:hypothetical protein [Agromyces sp. Marseille-P2726]|uniref:hypothetical protein n=1 Tax=Agromyces sp. Marseille-P2726 TaxID=2709132 RepID=UPI00156F0A6D|nr:hypothetical protein [Agromyces sp. Marseille-P2726]